MSDNGEPDTLEQIIDTMASTPYDELINLVHKHESVSRVFDQYKNRIFKEKTKTNYPCVSTAEEIFLIIDRSRAAYDNVCRRKAITTLPKWEDAKTYFRKGMIDIIVKDEGLFVTRMERIPFSMILFTNFHQLHKMRPIADTELWNDVIYLLSLFSTIYTATRNQFTRSYLETRVDEFFSREGIGGKLMNIAEYKLGMDISALKSKAEQMLADEGRLIGDMNINVLGQQIQAGAIFVTFRAIIDRDLEFEEQEEFEQFEE